MMILNKAQKYVIEALEKLSSLREDQVRFLLRLNFADLKLEQTVKCLILYGLIRRCDNIFYFPGKNIDSKIIDAVDIMIDVSGESLMQYLRGTEPFLLTFFKEKDGKLWRYDICSVAFGTEIVMNAALENINTKYRKIIFLLEREEQIPALHVNCEHFFTVKQDNKFHYFSKGEN